MYSDLTTSEQILLAVDFLARDVHVPQELQADLGPAIMLDLMTPEFADVG